MSTMLDNTSIIIVTHNHKKYLEKCLDSIPLNLEVIIVDNVSTDGTLEIITENYPEIKLIKSKENLGYGKAVNLGVKNTNKEYLIILNPDTWFKPKFVEELIEPLKNYSNLISIPKVLLYDGSQINTCGNVEHFTGLTFARGLGETKESCNNAGYLGGLSGVCLATRRKIFLKIGGFDENIFLYMEDAELSWKINANNLKILYIPQAILYHDYTLKVPAEKIYNLEMGRYIILRKYFTWKLCLMFLPSLVLTEMFTWGYAFLNGYNGLKFKYKAINDGFNVNVKKIDCNRKQLLESLDYKFPNNKGHNLLNNNVKKISNLIYFMNYTFIMTIWNLQLHIPNSSNVKLDNIKETSEFPEDYQMIRRIK